MGSVEEKVVMDSDCGVDEAGNVGKAVNFVVSAINIDVGADWNVEVAWWL